ncbi:hypothetical protein F5876DRAFT_69433 [Lentinula aff. lateritia]|uniref:Uncharacterized protein n=1 Tax=Lentinula aff. lateritia TaxID=2804960 RepID=A0ACC1TMN2_9AGAR|nr:hypothetical protein F5876DRAFT_69433 [Lentinula aff. lateritia]
MKYCGLHDIMRMVYFTGHTLESRKPSEILAKSLNQSRRRERKPHIYNPLQSGTQIPFGYFQALSSESSVQSAATSPATVSSISISEGPQTPPFPPSPIPISAAAARRTSGHRASVLRASVFDAFAELGAFDENSQIAEWIFNPDVDDASFSNSSTGPRKHNVHFLEKSGSRFRERLNSDASGNLLNGFTSPAKPPALPSSYSTSPTPTRRPTRRFFNGLRTRSASRHRTDKRRTSDETIVEETPATVSPSKKRPFLQFRSKSSRTIPTSSSHPPSSSLDLHRPSFLVELGHASSPSIATNASWEHIQGSASLDLLRSTDNSPVNTFLHGKHHPAPGIPFPSQGETRGGSLFLKLSNAVARPFSAGSIHTDLDARSSAAGSTTNSIRRTQSRPPEATGALKVTPLRMNFPSSFSSPSSPIGANPTTRALAAMEVL